MEHFLKYVLRIFRDSMPLAHIEERWANCALQLALSCSSRHCAGRSFQVQSYLFMKSNMMLCCAFPLFTQWRIGDFPGVISEKLDSLYTGYEFFDPPLL